MEELDGVLHQIETIHSLLPNTTVTQPVPTVVRVNGETSHKFCRGATPPKRADKEQRNFWTSGCGEQILTVHPEECLGMGMGYGTSPIE